MVMETKYRRSSYFTDQDDPQSSSENRPDSPLSGDDSRATATTAPSPKKRRSIQKKVVHVPIGDGDGSRSKGDSYPPSDSWAWRKYGQKPIKGSPYPRGYYRCSSSKGCPARKQLERNRLDPTMLIITYTCEHNHPLPTPKHHHNHHPSTTATAAADAVTTTTTPSIDNSSPTSPTTSDADNGGEPTSPAEQMMNPNPFADTTQLEYVGDSLMIGNLGVDYSWISTISDLSSFNVTTPSSSSLVGAACDDVEMSAFPMREEDESLFGDLGELPECSVVFRRSQQGSIERCTTGAPICGSTGREFFMLG